MLRMLPTLLFILALPVAAFGQQPHVLDILSIYRDLNDICRDRNEDERHKAAACNIREKVGRLLNNMGYCDGKQGQDATDRRWHKCAAHELF